MTAAGFESGTPAWILDADGAPMCGALQTRSMAQEVVYEESVGRDDDERGHPEVHPVAGAGVVPAVHARAAELAGRDHPRTPRRFEIS